MNPHCAQVRSSLPDYLQHGLISSTASNIRTHLDECSACWESWNRYRWDAAATHPLHRELRDFLGDAFQPYFDSSKALANEWDTATPATDAEIRAFYARSYGYLYNLAIWEASENRPPYVRQALPTLHAQNTTTIVDYGCGIGSDTLALRANGFTVVPCELPSPHAAFAAHRFRQHRQPAHVLDPAELHAPGPVDALWIIDTLDHLPDIGAALGTVLDIVSTVITENLQTQRQHGTQRLHIRRPYAKLQSILALHGLWPSVEHQPTHVAYWRRHNT